jgi:hypothetical protein
VALRGHLVKDSLVASAATLEVVHALASTSGIALLNVARIPPSVLSFVASTLKLSSGIVSDTNSLSMELIHLALLASGVPVAALEVAHDFGIGLIDLALMAADTSVSAAQAFDNLVTIPAVLTSAAGAGLVITSGPLMVLGGLPGFGSAGLGVALITLGVLMKAPSHILVQIFRANRDATLLAGSTLRLGFMATKLATAPARFVLNATGAGAAIASSSLRVASASLNLAASTTSVSVHVVNGALSSLGYSGTVTSASLSLLTQAIRAGASVVGVSTSVAQCLSENEWDQRLHLTEAELAAGSKVLRVLQFPDESTAARAFAVIKTLVPGHTS